MGLIKFWVEISTEANAALVGDAKDNKRSRKKQAEFVLERAYSPAGNDGEAQTNGDRTAKARPSARSRRAALAGVN